MYLTVRGLVLRVSNYNDHDAILSILTHTHGKLTVKARGLRRKNSPLVAPCQLLTLSEFTLFEYRGMYTINEASAIELFQPIRGDLQLLSLCTYFAQVSDILCQEDIPNPDLLSLVLNCFYALSKLGKTEWLTKAVFEMRAACLAGYTPDLTACASCGNNATGYFNVSEGHLECTSCMKNGYNGLRLPVSPGALDAMRFVCACGPKQLFSFQIGEETARELSQITEAYLSTQLERGFSTLDFYKTLLYEP